MNHNLDLVYKKYSEIELEKHIHLFNTYDWWDISGNQRLSESFIEKNKDKIYWKAIFRYQELSKEFIQKHIYKLHIDCLLKNKNISDEIKEEIKILMEII